MPVGKTRRRKRTIGRKKTHRRRSVVVVGRHHAPRRRRRSVGAVGKTHHRRRRRVGSTKSHKGLLMSLGKYAIGAGAGFVANHYILHPLEKKIEEHMPAAAKFMGIAQGVLGGIIAIKAKGDIGKAFGFTLLVGGVHSAMRTFHLNEKLGIHGPEDGYSTIRIPMSGTDTQFHSMVAGLLNNNSTPHMPTVMDSGNRVHTMHSKQALTNSYSGERGTDPRLRSYVGEGGDPYDVLYTAKGANY